MSYQQLLAQALLALGEGGLAQAEPAFQLALDEAARVDPEGPRVAEVLNYRARAREAGGDAPGARADLERAQAIWERLPKPWR